MVSESGPFQMSSSAEDDDELYQSGDTSSLVSLSQPLLHHGENTEYYKKPRKHVLSDSLFAERNKKLAKICVMITVTLERIVYYSLLGNLTFFANAELGYMANESINVALGFSGITWLSCFIGGVIGDVLLGRYKTIITGILLYLVGFSSLSVLGHLTEKDRLDDGRGRQKLYVAWFLSTLFIISLGEGCFKSNMSPFGADQLDTSADSVEMRTFFNYFYWLINLGSLIAFSLVAWIQVKYNFCIGYLIPCGLIALAGIAFIIPRKTNYHVTSPKRSVSLIFKIIKNSFRKQKRIQSSYEDYNPMESRLDRAKIKYGGKFLDSDVDDVKILISLLPTLLFLIIYCSCYFQISGLFFIQGMHLRLPEMPKEMGGAIPVAWFQLFNVVTVLLFVPIADKLIYPILDKRAPRSPHTLRISIGMILASLSMISAALLETKRLEYKAANHTHINTVIGADHDIQIDAVDLWVWFQLPQYLIMGISEVFVLITGLEFAYCRAPKSMQSFVTSLFFVVNGIGAFLTSLIITIGNSLGCDFLPKVNIKPSDEKHPIKELSGHLERFFYLMAGLNFLNWLGFVVYSIKRSRKIHRRDLERTVAAFIQNSYEGSLRVGSPQSEA